MHYDLSNLLFKWYIVDIYIYTKSTLCTLGDSDSNNQIQPVECIEWIQFNILEFYVHMGAHT